MEYDNKEELVEHMPKYIINAPWYVGKNLEEEISLKHQKLSEENINKYTPTTENIERGFYDIKIYKYRKGACENCGAITHKTKDCFERPRRRGAKYTKNNFGHDEYIKDVNFDFESKRDRWNGYNPILEIKKFEEYEKIQENEEKEKNTKDKENNDIEKQENEEEKIKEKNIMELKKLIKEKSIKDSKQNKKLNENIEKYGGGDYYNMPENIKHTIELQEVEENNNEEDENSKNNGEIKVKTDEVKWKNFQTMKIDKRTKIRMAMKKMDLYKNLKKEYNGTNKNP